MNMCAYLRVILLWMWPLHHSGHFLLYMLYLIGMIRYTKNTIFFQILKFFKKLMSNSMSFWKILEKRNFRPFVAHRILDVYKWYLQIYIAHNIAVIYYIHISYFTRLCAKFAEARKMTFFFNFKKFIYIYILIKKKSYIYMYIISIVFLPFFFLVD